MGSQSSSGCLRENIHHRSTNSLHAQARGTFEQTKHFVEFATAECILFN